MTLRSVRAFHITGWVLFILSALFFVWSTAVTGDMVGLVASLLFLVACFVFLIQVLVLRPVCEETSS